MSPGAVSCIWGMVSPGAVSCIWGMVSPGAVSCIWGMVSPGAVSCISLNLYLYVFLKLFLGQRYNRLVWIS